MRSYFLFLIFSFLVVSMHAQTTNSFEFASATKREEEQKKLISMVDKTIEKEFSTTNYKEWKGACWAMELMLYKPTTYAIKIPVLLSKFGEYDANMQWILLQNIFTLYPIQFAKAVEAQFQKAKNDKIKALMLSYLQVAGVTIQFNNSDSFLQSAYYKAFINYYKPAQKHNFSEESLLHKDFLPNQTILISFQHHNRDIPGYLMIRNADGTWLKDASGKPYRFTQLARSITNMPYFLTNGNTPQGLYRVVEFYNSSNLWIGPTTSLVTIMPFERELKSPFFADTSNAYLQYKKLLGPFSNNTSLWESYEAGKLGRSEIIAHGTTIPEKFYTNTPYYPCTPSLGCLCSPEIWDKSGKLVSSVQQQWIQLVQQLPVTPTWLLVVDL